MGTWTNGDGLYIKYGQTEGAVANGGELRNDGVQRVIEFELDLTTLSASADTIINDNIAVPVGALLEKVEVVVSEVTAGTNSNLDLGLIDQDRTTEIDLNGLIAAGDDWHTSAIGTRIIYEQGSTEHGALLGTILTNAGYVTAKADTAAFTDGTLYIRLFYFIP